MKRAERNAVPARDAEVRKRDFAEVAIGYTPEQARDEAARCLQCKHAPCKDGCPVGIDIPRFIAAVSAGKPQEACRIIMETNSLPAVCGRVCPQEEQCEKVCVRRKMEGAVAIGALERYAADNTDIEITPASKRTDDKKNKVAVVGSGPAGLACAAACAKAGMYVTLFEAFHKAGGVLLYGIPEFRLPKKIVRREIDKLLALGVNIELNTVIGKTITLEELRSEYGAIFLGSGAGLPVFLGIPGENLNEVLSANEYLTRINLMGAYKSESHTPVIRGNNAIVIGAGNVAMDAARTAKRLGAENVTIVYRRTREEMPAREEEIRHAEEEGILFRVLTAPREIEGAEGHVRALKCVSCELGEPDSSGRRSPVEIDGSDFSIPCDMVIVAVGTSPNPLLKRACPGLRTEKKGTVVIDGDMMTSIEGVYAGGDAVTGAATVISAMGAGRKAAQSIIKRAGII